VASLTSVTSEIQIMEKVLCEYARFSATSPPLRIATVFDRENGAFLLVDEGWDGYKRIYNTWAHVELRNGKIYIEQDLTEAGLANDLVAAGIPESRIVLNFKHPSLRQDTNFAIA
jgi:hypothetical protein